MTSTTFTLTGDVSVQITVTELDDGSLKFDLFVTEDTGSIGDLNALYLDILDDTLVDGLSVSGTDVTGEKFKADSVTKIDNFTNINGEVVKDYGKFDLGVQFGTSGIGTDDIQSTSFILSHDTTALTIDMFTGQDAAVRLTSVGEIDGSRDDSSKIGGTLEPEEPTGPVHLANDDSMTVSNNETFSEFENDPDPLDGFAFSLLENDTTDGALYLGDVLQGDGMDLPLTDPLTGSNGGLLILNADGTVDFSANGEFDQLAANETTTTHFTYGIEGGSTATLTVTVFGFDPDGGGGGGGDFPLPPPDDPFGF